jgi:hypothetical protein
VQEDLVGLVGQEGWVVMEAGRVERVEREGA